jgi:hypothetical protein
MIAEDVGQRPEVGPRGSNTMRTTLYAFSALLAATFTTVLSLNVYHAFTRLLGA